MFSDQDLGLFDGSIFCLDHNILHLDDQFVVRI